MTHHWTTQRPTEADAGKWFFVMHDDGVFQPAIRFKQIRIDSKFGELYLCPENDMGITVTSFGTPLSMYNPKYTKFWGPVEVPRVERQRDEKDSL